MHRRIARCVGILLLAGLPRLTVADPPPAPGTQSSAEPSGLIARASLERYGRLLTLELGQTEAAAVLYDGYATAFRSAVREYRDACAKLRRSEPDKPDALQKLLAEARTAHLTKIEELERTFMGDLKSLLTATQANSWPAVERARRREWLLRGVISGESVDLIRLVESFRPTPEETVLLAAPLAAYELELDRALQDKARVLKDEDPFAPRTQMNAQDVMRWTTRSREIGLTIRDLNINHAKRIELELPEARRLAFRAAFKTAAFPAVYRPTPGTTLLAAIAQMTDLDPSQTETLRSIRASYERDLAAARDKLESAIIEAETAQRAASMPQDSGGSMYVLMGSKENPVLLAMQNKDALDVSLRESLNTLLKPAQLDRLPEPPSSPDQVFMDDTAVMIMRGG